MKIKKNIPGKNYGTLKRQIVPVYVSSQWNTLIQFGSWAAYLVAAFIPFQAVIYFLWPPPENVIGWFQLFEQHPIVGLLNMDLLLTVDYILLGIVFLALYQILKGVSSSLMTLSLFFQLLSLSVYMASTSAFEMLALSHQYSAATGVTERANVLAAGKAVLVAWQGTAFSVSYLLGALSILFLSYALLKTKVFNRLTAYLGLLMGFLMLLPPTAGKAGIFLSLLSLLPSFIWMFLIGYQLRYVASQTGWVHGNEEWDEDEAN